MIFECIIEYIFKPQTKPFVSNIDDVIERKDINVWIEWGLHYLLDTRPKAYNSLLKRANNYNEKYEKSNLSEDDIYESRINEMHHAKTILIGNTLYIDAIMTEYNFQELPLHKPDDKYGLVYNCYGIHRKLNKLKHKYEKQLSHFIEIGLYIHQKGIEIMLSKFYIVFN